MASTVPSGSSVAGLWQGIVVAGVVVEAAVGVCVDIITPPTLANSISRFTSQAQQLAMGLVRTYTWGMRDQHDRRYAAPAWGAVEAPDTRDRFLVRTYNHLFGAIVLFAGIEFALFMSGLALPIARTLLSGSWLIVMGAFMLVGWGASHVAHRAESKAAQYAALGAYVVLQAIIFVPMLYLAQAYAPGTIQSAGLITILGFAALTGIVFWTRKDFSFLGAILRWVGIGVILLIIASLIFGFQLGTLFSVGMIVFAGAAILYDTSRVLHDFPEDRHVAASLELFSSVAMLFWYVLRLLMELNRR